MRPGMTALNAPGLLLPRVAWVGQYRQLAQVTPNVSNCCCQVTGKPTGIRYFWTGFHRLPPTTAGFFHKGIGMNKFALAGVFLVAGTAGAMAADMSMPVKAAPVVPPCVWCGWYVGANGGYAWNGRSSDLVDFTTAFTTAVAVGGTPLSLGAKHEGGFGGGQVGYNWMISTWLLGVEADIQGASIGSTNTIAFPGAPGGNAPSVSTGRDHIDWFGTVRGRLGVTVDQVLFYATGGLAYGGIHSSATNVFVPAAAGNFAGSLSDTSVGFAGGAGVEWMFAPSWSLKGEYLHVDLGSTSVVITDPARVGATATYRFHHDFDSVRVGVNYHLGGPVVARY
jgi:outer membrane immunogenic protein